MKQKLPALNISSETQKANLFSFCGDMMRYVGPIKTQ